MRRLLTLFRRLRALAVNAFLWAVLWAVAGGFVGGYAALRSTRAAYPFLPDLIFFAAFALGFYGAVGGLLFGVVLMLLERFSMLGRLSPGRAAIWGALAGLVLPALFAAVGRGPIPITWSIAVVCGVLGMLCASGTLALVGRPGQAAV